MASVKKRVGERGTTYRITIYKGYLVKNGKRVQNKETTTYTLDEMGISAVTDKGNPRSDSSIMKDVQLYADNLEKRMTGAAYMKGDKVRLIDFYEQSWKPYAKSHFADSTYYMYTKHLDEVIMPEIGSIKIGRITPEHLTVLYSKLAQEGSKNGRAESYSRGSIVTFHKQLQSVMTLAKKYKVIEDNPCKNAELPNVTKQSRIRYLTPEQTSIFLEILDNPAPCVVTATYDWGKKTSVYGFNSRAVSRLQYNTFRALFRVAVFSGCRIGELLALTWKDIDFKTDTISIRQSVAYAVSKGGQYIKDPKTENSYRSVVIEHSEILMLQELRVEQKMHMLELGSAWKGNRDNPDDNFVFSQYDGHMINKSSPNKMLDRLVQNHNASVPKEKQLPHLSVHDLRHTHATLLVAGGTDVKTISARLGHKNIGTTLNIYAHALKEKDAQASATVSAMLNTKRA